MELDVEYLISFFKKFVGTDKNEIGEQDAAAPTGGGGKTPPKWADSYPITRGKANRLGISGEKWETGLTRGAANQIW